MILKSWFDLLSNKKLKRTYIFMEAGKLGKAVSDNPGREQGLNFYKVNLKINIRKRYLP
jgi:hypothetical protein